MALNKSIKISLILINVFTVLLIVFTATLPFLVSWYVETMHRSETLMATIMVTCYPCSPFTLAILFFLRKLLKNVSNEAIFIPENIRYFNRISVCCIIIAVITLIAGRYYLPFYIVGGTFSFLSLLIYSLQNIFNSAVGSLNAPEEPSEEENNAGEQN